jgi:DNA-binding NtrC family response regulator
MSASPSWKRKFPDSEVPPEAGSKPELVRERLVDGIAKPAEESVGFVGRDPKIVELLELVQQVADTTATVLITGESGTGKELIAQLIWRGSSRRNRPFVAVNCGAVPESLQESEFFGHVKGAFTGATERKIGKLELADRGTIFLDEIGEMSRSLQVALLRTLQSGEYSPVGQSETRYCDVRVIAAANCRLLDLVDAGQFRCDLYYRLNIIHLELPPLRERRGDIALLCENLLKRLGDKHNRAGVKISPATQELLLRYDYPGNVRELENIIRRALILTTGPVIEPHQLPPELSMNGRADLEAEQGDFQTAKSRAIEEFERSYLTGMLKKCGGIVSRAAHYSGLSERNFHEKLKRYRISAKSFRAPLNEPLEQRTGRASLGTRTAGGDDG